MTSNEESLQKNIIGRGNSFYSSICHQPVNT